MTIKEFFSTKNKFFWLNLLGMVILAIVIIFVVLKSLDVYTRHGEAVVVPNAKGMTIQQAKVLFANEGFTTVVADSTYIKEQPAGIVLEHNPPTGQKVKKGRTIYLTINTVSVPLQIVPDVADNSSRRQAEARLLASGFKLNDPEMIIGEKDWVYSIKFKGKKLEPGEKVPTGATLTLVVGDGTRDDFEDVENDSTMDSSESLSLEESWF